LVALRAHIGERQHCDGWLGARARAGRIPAGRGVPHLHDGDETKTAPLNRANHRLTVAVVARKRPRLAHDLRECRIRDDRARPEVLE
jgi:hypothetical protein